MCIFSFSIDMFFNNQGGNIDNSKFYDILGVSKEADNNAIKKA